MSKRIFALIDKFIINKEPEIEELNDFLEEIIVNDEISPTDKTILTRYSKVKNYLREKYGSELSEDEIKIIKPPADVVNRVLEKDQKTRQKKINIKFNQQDIEKILSFKDSKNLFEKYIYLQFISGRRLNEIKEFAHNMRIPKGKTYKIKMKLSKKKYDKESDMDEVQLIPNQLDNVSFRKKVKNIRDITEDISTSDFNKRVNKYIKKNLNKQWSSHVLRGLYAHYMFHNYNAENLNINGFLTQILNHDSSDASLNYSNFVFDK